MDIEVKISKVENMEDHYDLEMSTYIETISGRFEHSKLRSLIETIDNALLP